MFIYIIFNIPYKLPLDQHSVCWHIFHDSQSLCRSQKQQLVKLGQSWSRRVFSQGELGPQAHMPLVQGCRGLVSRERGHNCWGQGRRGMDEEHIRVSVLVQG